MGSWILAPNHTYSIFLDLFPYHILRITLDTQDFWLIAFESIGFAFLANPAQRNPASIIEPPRVFLCVSGSMCI